MPTQPVAMTPIQIGKIHSNPNQPRKIFDPQAIEDLKESMDKRGLIGPIAVFKSGEDDYTIIAGERRYRAALELRWDSIDCRIWPAETTPQEVDMLALVENTQRQDLNPIERARGYQRLAEEFKMSHDEIAQAMGMPNNSTVSRFIALLDMPQEIQDLLPRGSISEGHCRALRQITDKNKQIELANRIDKEGWSVRETEKRVETINTPAAEKPGKVAADPVYNAGGQLFQFSGKGKRFSILTAPLTDLDMLDVYMQNLRCALVDYISAKTKSPPS
jgi:ParB family chromosome partitioning protein